MSDSTKRRNRIVIETSSGRHSRGARPAGRQSMTGGREGIVALTVIGAAALATFIALFLTSRPYDPMNSTLAPNETVPAGSLVIAPSPSPKASPSTSPSPELNLAAGGIQFQIDRTLTADPVLSKLDVSTLVEGGKVTIVGSVRSAELKQRVEKTIRSLKGVVSVDNQLVVTEATP